MYTSEINFTLPKTNFNKEEVVDTINSLLGVYRMNGQVLGREFPGAKTKGAYKSFILIPEKDSLKNKYNNIYVNQRLKSLKELGVKVSYKIIREELDYAPICKCKKNKSYVLFTTYLTLESPIRCGECFGTIPLYRIPYVSGEEHYDIIGWQSNYQSCDMLQMNCSVGEKFGLNQMGKLDSALTKEGLEICRTIKEKTKINTYYYLYRYTERKPNSKENRKCPSCNKTWRLKERLHLFDYKCDRCLLLSNL